MNTVQEGIEQATDYVSKQPIQEGKITQQIENQTAKIPSVFFLSLALGSVALSAGLATSKRTRDAANFVGLWAPTLLLLGIYNKIVKIEGNDRFSRS